MKPFVVTLLFCLAVSFAASQTNTAPKIFADVYADYLGTGAFLVCSTADDGLIRPLTFTWSKMNGPGVVVFNAFQGKMTHARFSAKGFYTIQCAVSDGQFNVVDTVTVLVDSYADAAVRPN